MARLFISYRRDDAGIAANRLFAVLGKRFGKQQIFMDVQSMKSWLYFVQQLEERVTSCDAIIVLIGRNWAPRTGRRLPGSSDATNDYVVLEIAAGLMRHIPVIPVLLDGATMPHEDDLPEAIRAFAKYHAFELTDQRWDYDVRSLLAALDGLTGGEWKRKVRMAAGAVGGLGGFWATNACVAPKVALVGSAAVWSPIAQPVLLGGGALVAGCLAAKGVKRLLNRL